MNGSITAQLASQLLEKSKASVNRALTVMEESGVLAKTRKGGWRLAEDVIPVKSEKKL